MPRSKGEDEEEDDLEGEEGDEEEEDDAEDDEEDGGEEEDEEEESDAKPAKKAKTVKKAAKAPADKALYGILLHNSQPVKVEVVSIRGELAKVRKPKSDDNPLKVQSSALRVFTAEGFDALQLKYEKVVSARDAVLTAHQKLDSFKGKSGAVKKRRRGLDSLIG